MDAPQLRDEAVRDRIRAAEEFLDPSKCFKYFIMTSTYDLQTMCVHAVIERISFSCLTVVYGDFLLVNTRQPYPTSLTRIIRSALTKYDHTTRNLQMGRIIIGFYKWSEGEC